MEVTTKELRIQPGKIIEQVVNGVEVTVTFRGKALARIIPLKDNFQAENSDEDSVFGIWKDYDQTDSVENFVWNNRAQKIQTLNRVRGPARL